ncbi:MAG: hypothetical protein RIT81_32535 [Deltaproteobacteria bacterium]
MRVATICGLAWILVAALLPANAYADDFFTLSPAPLSSAHAAWDDRAGCEKCHKLGGGVTEDRCLSCHDHKNLARTVRAGRGLHARFVGRPCSTCHTEHKGRAGRITDWGPVGGRRKFDHEKTGFTLDGRHRNIACTKCHLKKLKSGRTSYLGLKRTCDGCHGNTHRFTNTALVKGCESCHPKGGGKKTKLTAESLPFDHAKQTGTALSGLHAKAQCDDCHAKNKMPMKTKRSCGGCHRQPHGRTFRRSDCSDCHAVTKRFVRSSFSHDRTDFKLRGVHKKPNCSRCHKRLKTPPKPTCQGCHGKTHRKRFAGLGCKSCHGVNGDHDRFDHARRADFALTGKHEALKCRDCHRGRRPWRFERHKTSACRDCHSHANAHNGEFDDKECAQCHAEGGSKDVKKFDHNTDARFALTGKHATVECSKCHEGNQFRTGKTACNDCHEDAHRGQLGQDCAKCHATDVVFADIAFDHDQTTFPLVGLHTTAKCEGCHVNGEYALGEPTCIDCHRADDEHLGALGKDCAKCHEPKPGASKFEHDVLTEFPLTGRHDVTDCGYCHVVGDPKSPPPPVGWTQTVAKRAADPQFPVRGEACADCHFDVHEGAYGRACDNCHDTGAFSNVQRAVHDTGAFRLLGTHDRLACQRCHEPQQKLAGLGTYCVGCHRHDDIHDNALGGECGDCHAQFDWRPARFNHTLVGFMLRGAHMTVGCRDCHQVGVFAGTPRDCDRCHLQDAAKTVSPPHGPEMMVCEDCHTPVAFTPAKRNHPWFPLEGQHIAAPCESCHTMGTYAGTPRECESCHLDSYQSPTTQPNHVSAGMSTDCASCHRPTMWSGARYVHQTFIRRGAHQVAPCTTCHPGDDYRAAFGGRVVGFECAQCHGPTGEASRWPASHRNVGYPTTCDVCHNEIAWTPARKPR